MLRFTKSSNPGTSKTGWHCDWPLNATSIISQDVQLLYSYWWIHISTKASLVSSANSRRYSAAPVKLVSCPAILTRVWLEKRPTNLVVIPVIPIKPSYSGWDHTFEPIPAHTHKISMPSQHCKMVPTIRFTAFDQCELVAGNDFSALALVTALRNNH